MTDTPLRDASRHPEALARLDDLPTREAEIGVVARDGGDVGIAGQVSAPIGTSWSVAAAGAWMKQAGWSVAAKLGWKGR